MNTQDTDLPEALKVDPVAHAAKHAKPAKPATEAKATNTASAPAPEAKPAKTKKATASAKAPKKAKVAKDKIPEDARRTIVPVEFKARYAATNDTCGDRLGLALKAATTIKNKEGRLTLDWPALKAIAKANGVDVAKYEGLNNGQKRMNVGNKLRGLLKGGETVKVGDKSFTEKTGLFKAAPKAEHAQAA